MQELLKIVEEYLKQHPELEELLRQFNISREQYEQYIAMTMPPKVEGNTTVTNEVNLNVNLSGTSR